VKLVDSALAYNYLRF